MANDDCEEHSGSGFSRPTSSPSEPPQRISRPTSLRRASSRRSSSPGFPSSSPPPPMPSEHQMPSPDAANDEYISVLDPRRFTPTLHASLVAEILSLRRELDSKHKFIETLETSLEDFRVQNVSLGEKLSRSHKENRALKGQFHQLEGGTLTAMEELAKERDSTRDANIDLRNKLEAAQKQAKSLEDDSSRLHLQLEQEKHIWETECGGLRRRLHATETRLRIVLDELETQHAAAQGHEHGHESELEDGAHDGGRDGDSDAASLRTASRPGSAARTRAMHSRTMSSSSHRSAGRIHRLSTMSYAGHHGGVGASANGISLADELNFDEEDEELEELEIDSDDYPENEYRARRAMESRQSMRPDEKAKRILGLADEARPQSALDCFDAEDSRFTESPTGTRGRPPTPQLSALPIITHTPFTAESILAPSEERASVESAKKPEYVDTGVQFTPPPSPARYTTPRTNPVRSPETPSSSENEANQRRKRVASPSGIHASPPVSRLKALPSTVSASSQTSEQQPLSPPDTPKISGRSSSELPDEPPLKVETSTTSTQTDPVEVRDMQDPPVKSSKRIPPPPPIPVPSIAIHPPLSAPSSPREPRLPPGTQNASCQTGADLAGPVASIAIQTEEIRVDKRLVKLPAHLLPSAITGDKNVPKQSQSTAEATAMAGSVLQNKFTSEGIFSKLVQHNQAAAVAKSEVPIEDKYPGNNDNGPLVMDASEVLRRPYRTSSLFAGFDGPSSDEEDLDEGSGVEFTDTEPRPQRQKSSIAGRAARHGRALANPPTPVPEEKEGASRANTPDEAAMKAKGKQPVRNSLERPIRTSLEKPAKVDKQKRFSGTMRRASIRRATLVQLGRTQGRTHSPTGRNANGGTVAFASAASEAGPSSSTEPHPGYMTRPPFPVPIRSSSWMKLSKSEGSQSPTPGVGGARRHQNRKQQHGPKPSPQDSLRKVRSAAAIPSTSRQRHERARSRSPPPKLPPLDTSFQLSSVPPLPRDVVASPHYSNPSSALGHRTLPSTNTSHTGSGSAASSQASVIDSITTTMVGEWMWKYVRRRKSFGVQESSAAEGPRTDETASGLRHKRWVWLSPYERTVMWSSKQPTTNAALLGKSGRKLPIQSVLDVPDNTPLPKGSTAQDVFSRSILILTPARALKFTATSKERHYLWLTALSFLAHSRNSQAHELADLPAPLLPSAEDLGAAPPPPSTRPQRAVLRRGAVRDSVRLAKDRNQSQPAIGRQAPPAVLDSPRSGSLAAEAPSIPRFGPHHGRKRSLTGPRAPPPSALRSFSYSNAPTHGPPQARHHQSVPPTPTLPHSAHTTVAPYFFDGAGPHGHLQNLTHRHGPPPSVPSTIYNPGSSAVTSASASDAGSARRFGSVSEAAGSSSGPGAGTVRMEAFVEPTFDVDGMLGGPPPPRAPSSFSSSAAAVAAAATARRPGGRRQPPPLLPMQNHGGGPGAAGGRRHPPNQHQYHHQPRVRGRGSSVWSQSSGGTAPGAGAGRCGGVYDDGMPPLSPLSVGSSVTSGADPFRGF